MRKALCVGINNYPKIPLKGCINDAKEMTRLLSKNFDGSVNFDVKKIYLDVDAKMNLGATPVSADVDLDPWVIGAGVSYRF